MDTETVTPEPAVEPIPVVPGTDYEVVREPEYASRPIRVETLFSREQGRPPDPPCKLLDRYPDRVWRWMGKAHVDKHGMRAFTSYSVSAKEKAEIDRGQYAGIRVTETNLIWWREDAFLAWRPRYVQEQREAEKRVLVDDLTKRSRPDVIPGTEGRTESSMSVTSTQKTLREIVSGS
jgi:hypothetical protein